MPSELDFLFVPVGGGALIAGMSIAINKLSPETQVVGVEPHGANSMSLSLEKGSLQAI